MARVDKRQTALIVCIFILFLFVKVGYSAETVMIEFIYYECSECRSEEYEIYLHNNQVVEDIQRKYGSRVSVEKIYFYSEEGIEKIEQYGIGITDWNSVVRHWNCIVIDHEKVILGRADEAYVMEIVDSYSYESARDVAIINVTPSHSFAQTGEKISINVTVKNVGRETESFNVNVFSNEALIGTQLATNLSPNQKLSMIFDWDTTKEAPRDYIIEARAEPVTNETNLANNIYVYSKIVVTTSPVIITVFLLALSLGFFETFSPCLIILMSFVLSYTLGKTAYVKDNFLKVMSFGTGFIFSSLLLAVAFGLIFLSMPMLQHSLTWVVCVFALVFGLNLLGVLKIPFKKRFQSKPLIRKFARKYVATYAGLFLLGLVFYFLDPCIAPIFISMMPLLLPEMLLFTLLVFCLGAIIPFIAFGIFASSISKLARSTYRHQVKIRAFSGLILISYALYLIIFYLLPKVIIYSA